MAVKITRRVQSRSSLPHRSHRPNSNFVTLLAFITTASLVYVGYYMNAIYHELQTQRRMKLASVGMSSLENNNPPVAAGRLSDSELMLAAEQDTERFLKSGVEQEFLSLETADGTIRMLLRPDLSRKSVDYIKAVVASGSCPNCIIHAALRAPRSTKASGIVQGAIANRLHVSPIDEKGPCPIGTADASTACHGPIMTRGMVAWSSGLTGPAFFINTLKRPGHHWGTSHTVFAQVLPGDVESWRVIDALFELPFVMKKRQVFRGSTKESTIKLLKTPIHFSLRISPASEVGIFR